MGLVELLTRARRAATAVGLAAALGCEAVPPPAATTAAPAPAVAPAPTPKPGAPVDVQLAATPLPDGRTRVTLTATPTVDTEALELRLGARHETRRAVRAGQSVQLVVDAPAGAERMTGGAATIAAGRRRSRGEVIELAAPAQKATPAPVRVVQLPGGESVAEVRP